VVLLFARPAIGAQLARLDADGGHHIVKALIHQRGEGQLEVRG